MDIKRNNVWETNSSSTHALVVTKQDNNLKKPGVLKLSEDGEYSWESRIYDSIDDKFTYLLIIASAIEVIKGYNKEERSFYFKGTIPNPEQNEVMHFLNVLQELGFTFENGNDDTQEYIKKQISKTINDSSYYYIDHDSEAIEFYFALMEDLEKLKRFLLSSDSFIITGNDNDDQDLWEIANKRYNLNLPYEKTEWGMKSYNTDPIEDKYDIYYKGN